MTLRQLIPTLTCLLTVGPAYAEKYWIAYDADDFPENVGWRRSYGDEYDPPRGGADRRIEDGVLVIDSLRHSQIFDYAYIERRVNPGPGELFIAEWRVRIVENHSRGPGDAGVTIARDGRGTLAFGYWIDRVNSIYERWSYPIEPLISHTYRIESTDMVSYWLRIDGVVIRKGYWDLNSINESYFAFGDGVVGARSLTEWDYVRFGVVPEPSTTLMFLTMLLTTGRAAFQVAQAQCIARQGEMICAVVLQP